MTEEMKEKIKAAHTEEVADHKKYKELSKEAENAGCERAAGILCDIAHDEETHIKALEHILEMEV